MLRADVDLELSDLCTTKPVARKHALDRFAQHFGRPALELLAQRTAPEPTGVTRMAVVHLLVKLVAGDLDLLRVDDDDEIAGVDVRGVFRLALAAQRLGDARREP